MNAKLRQLLVVNCYTVITFSNFHNFSGKNFTLNISGKW